MQKQEFEERIERTVTDEQYKVIEEVYMWHPSIRNTSGKDEVAELYKSFGMTIFHDMLPRAKKAHELDELLRNAQREVQRIQEEITHIALGSGGVNGDGTVIVPLAENVALKKEVVRKPYTSSTKTSDTSYEYTIKLEEDELVGTFISEMALIDEDGDVVAFSNFLAKGKDETEVTFTIEDNY